MNSNPEKTDTNRNWSLESLTLFGCVIAVGCYWCFGMGVESFLMPMWRQPDAPHLSYGKEFLFLMTPLAAAIGASASGSIAMVGRKTPKWLANTFLAIPVIILFLVLGIWRIDVTRNGYDLSAWVLYPPFLIIAPFCFALSLVLATVRQRRSRSNGVS